MGGGEICGKNPVVDPLLKSVSCVPPQGGDHLKEKCIENIWTA